MAQRPRRLYRSRTNRTLAGVLGGIAGYFDLDPSMVRIVYAVGTFFTVFLPGIVLYLAMAVIVPEEPAAGGAEPT